VSAPPGHWLLGHIPALRSDPLALLDACRPPAVPLRLGRTVWLLLEPADIDHVLQGSGKTWSKGQAFRVGRRLYGNSLLVSEGDEHRRQARLVGGLFFRHAARTFIEPAPVVADQLARRWQVGQRLDLWAAMLDLTLALSSQAIFGQDWLPDWLRPGDGSASAILQAFDDAMSHVARQNLSLLPVPDWLPVPASRRYRRAVARLDGALAESVARRQRGESSGGFLDHLLAARDDSGRPLTPQQVRDQALILVLGGYETTATALCWTLLLLGQHAEVNRKLLGEVDATLGERLPCADDAGKLRWTGQVFSEAMRLYPSPWLLPRTAVVGDELPSGLKVRAGAQVFLSPYRTQRDERFFPEPLCFDPERFAGRTWPDGAYFPFGSGPRHCIAESTSRAQVPLILAAMCRRWRLEPEAGALPRPVPVLTLRPPCPLWVRVRPAEK
jgi:cytochrome P450